VDHNCQLYQLPKFLTASLCRNAVVHAEAGTQDFKMDSCFRRNDVSVV